MAAESLTSHGGWEGLSTLAALRICGVERCLQTLHGGGKGVRELNDVSKGLQTSRSTKCCPHSSWFLYVLSAERVVHLGARVSVAWCALHRQCPRPEEAPRRGRAVTVLARTWRNLFMTTAEDHEAAMRQAEKSWEGDSNIAQMKKSERDLFAPPRFRRQENPAVHR